MISHNDITPKTQSDFYWIGAIRLHKVADCHKKYILCYRIFIEAGFANSHTEKCEKGDVMSLFCDVVSRQLVFYRNEREVSLSEFEMLILLKGNFKQ